MAKKQRDKASRSSLRRSAHHKKTGKYERQFARTAANKARRIAKQKRRSEG